MENLPPVIDDSPGVPTPDEYPMYQHYRDDVLGDEEYLDVEIAQLWGIRSVYTGTIKTEMKHQRAVDNTLGKLLYSMKAVLASPGRLGKWSAWLKERRIPRATADRMCARYADAYHLNADPSCLTEATKPEPTELQMGKLVTAVVAKCEKVLSSRWSRYTFIKLVTHRLGLTCEYRHGTFTIRDPDVPIEEPEIAVNVNVDDGDIFG
jgi:hypothetical protein